MLSFAVWFQGKCRTRTGLRLCCLTHAMEPRLRLRHTVSDVLFAPQLVFWSWTELSYAKTVCQSLVKCCKSNVESKRHKRPFVIVLGKVILCVLNLFLLRCEIFLVPLLPHSSQWNTGVSCKVPNFIFLNLQFTLITVTRQASLNAVKDAVSTALTNVQSAHSSIIIDAGNVFLCTSNFEMLSHRDP